MKRSPDNQINAFLIDILIIKWIVFCYGRLPSTQLDRWQAPKQRPSIDQRLVEQTAYLTEIKDNGYKSVFTNSCLVCKRNRCWIKLLGLLSGSTEPWPHGLWETLGCIHVFPPKDNGYKSVFTNSCLVCQRNRCWIKLLGLLSGSTEPWYPMDTCVYTRLPTQSRVMG